MSSNAFKDLCLKAINSPVELEFDTISAAHSARFQAYNAFKVMKRENDDFATTKELLEFIVRPARGGKGLLRIQRKTTNLMQLLSGRPVNETPASINHQPMDTTKLQQQVAAEDIPELDPTNPADAAIIRRVEVTDWLDSIDDQLTSDQHRQILNVLRTAGDVTLAEFRKQLSIAGIYGN